MTLRSANHAKTGAALFGDAGTDTVIPSCEDAAMETTVEPSLTDLLFKNLSAVFQTFERFPCISHHLLYTAAFQIAQKITYLTQKEDFFDQIGSHWRFPKDKPPNAILLSYSFHLTLQEKCLQLVLVPSSLSSVPLEGANKKIKMTELVNLTFNENKTSEGVARAPCEIVRQALIKSKNTASVRTILSPFLYLNRLPDEHVAKDYKILSLRFKPQPDDFKPTDSHIRELNEILQLIRSLILPCSKPEDSCFIPEDLKNRTNYRYKAKLELIQQQYAFDLHQIAEEDLPSSPNLYINQLSNKAKWLNQIASVLDTLEKNGSRHCDCKPSNIFIDQYKEAHLGDLDLFKPEVPNFEGCRWKIDPSASQYLIPLDLQEGEAFITNYQYWSFLDGIGIFINSETYGFLISFMETFFPDSTQWIYQSQKYNFRDTPEKMLYAVKGHDPKTTRLFSLFFLEKMKELSSILATMPKYQILDDAELLKIQQSASLEELFLIWHNLTGQKTDNALYLTKIASQIINNFYSLYNVILHTIDKDQKNKAIFAKHPKKPLKIEKGNFSLEEELLEIPFPIQVILPYLNHLSNGLNRFKTFYDENSRLATSTTLGSPLRRPLINPFKE